MNKLNFIYDCRHNIDNCIFVPISDELDEISYLKKHQNPFQKKCLVFLCCDLLEHEIETEFNTGLLRLSINYYYLKNFKKFAQNK